MGQSNFLVWLTTPNAITWIWIAPQKTLHNKKPKKQHSIWNLFCFLFDFGCCIHLFGSSSTVDRWAQGLSWVAGSCESFSRPLGWWVSSGTYHWRDGWLFKKALRVQCPANYHSHGETHWKIQPFWLYLPAMMGIFQPAMLITLLEGKWP